MNEITTGLIPCQTCNHEIGTQADNCPQCGSPNTWTHPKIKAMYGERTLNTARAIRFWHKGAEVWGESTHHSVIAYIGALFIIVVALFSALFWLLLGPVIGGVVLVLFWRSTAKKDTFRTNLVTRAWESSNDKFWKPVAEFLELQQGH